MGSPNRRIEVDVKKLANSEFKVELLEDSLQELTVEFPGPQDTPYTGGTWKVKVELPNDYPYSSPSVVFKTKIFHPNVDEDSGSVCLDVINQTWTPIFGLVNIFESFLPQLLAYPNADDPLNRRAAYLYFRDIGEYDREVKSYVSKYAIENFTVGKLTNESISNPPDNASDSDDMSSLDELSEDES